VSCDSHHSATETHDDDRDEEQADRYYTEEEQSTDEELPLYRPDIVGSTLPPDHIRQSRSLGSTPAMIMGSSLSSVLDEVLLPIEPGTPSSSPSPGGTVTIVDDTGCVDFEDEYYAL
jgi:hypothetical protein